jgi:PAS domain S-box-containing protein
LELTKLSLESDDPSLTVTTMQIPSDALKLLSDQPFDCIVSDYQMPGMDGTKFCTEIKKTRTIPFIIYTGRGSDEIASDVFTAGADDYVKKEMELAHFKVLARRIRHAVEKSRAENALKVSEERYRTLFSNMMNGFAYCKMIQDQNGKPEDFTYLEVNDSFERLTGLKREEVIGRKVSEAIPGIKEGKPELIDIYGRVSSTGVPASFELFLKPLSIWLSISAYSPEKGYFVAIFDDITQRKRAEEVSAAANKELNKTNEGLQTLNTELAVARERVQERAYRLEGLVEEEESKLRESDERLRSIQQMDTISRIGATVAHDLRGPLIAISQAAEIARKKQELSDRMLLLISSNAERSLHMIEGFREGTRDVKVVKRKVDLSSLVKEVVDGVPKPENISLDMQLRGGLEDVSLDPELMRRVLDNLVRNGYEAMPEGVKLTVSARRVGEEVVMEVGDTGVGISEEASKHIFEPLFTTKKGGLGLGLYFVKMVVEGHGGKVGFVSKLGEGTTFTIRLPTQ